MAVVVMCLQINGICSASVSDILAQLQAEDKLAESVAPAAEGTTALEDNSPVFTEYISDNGRMIKIPIPANKVESIKELLNNLREEGVLQGLTAFVSETANRPALVIVGDSASAAELRDKLKFIIGDQLGGPKFLVEVTVNLREMSQADINQIGLNLFPSINKIGGSIGQSSLNTDSSGQITEMSNNKGSLGATLSIPDIDFRQIAALGRALVTTEVLTPNGITTEINSEDYEPVLVSSDVGINTREEAVETSVIVTPLIVRYDKNNPLNSLVKLDIEMDVSLPLGTVKAANSDTEAAEFTTKRLTTERVVKTDGKQIFAGSFVTDTNNKSGSYAPVLSEVPLLKYFFSKENTTNSRSASVLFISVRLMPLVAK